MSATATGSKQSRESWGSLLEASAREVFEVMLGCPLTELPEIDSATGPGITSMVGLAGSLSGIIAVRTSLRGAAVMAERMLGVSLDEADPQCWDATGEVANMIAGNFKNKLNTHDEQCMLSVPTVIAGDSYTLHPLGASSEVCLKLAFDERPLLITLDIEQ
jgi:chemotaxis protein CheX